MLSNIISMPIVDDVRVTVPDSPMYLSSYILAEQHDWFEDEIKFIRHFIKPGMQVIDIGANYGLYTLSMAKILGDSGKIWAFEPASTTAACLQNSIAENKFTNIEIIQAGLSNNEGEAKLYTSPNAELNSLSEDSGSGDQFELVSLLTLDQCTQKYEWENIDFIKLDAEGEEFNILQAGNKTLAKLSPLIMFELKHKDNINISLIKQFQNLGYTSYRLIPGLNTLIPFNPGDSIDNYLLNLFCCKDDTLQQLENDGYIVNDWSSKCENNYPLTEQYIGNLEFGETLLKRLANTSVQTSQDYRDILNSYIMSLSPSESSADRVSYLMSAMNLIRTLLKSGENNIARLVTFSRIAFDAGERELGVNILDDLIKKHNQHLDFTINDLLLPATKKYDIIPPGKELNAWLYSSILEQFIDKHAYSTYFTKTTALPLFERLDSLGFSDENMQYRHSLIKKCFVRDTN